MKKTAAILLVSLLAVTLSAQATLVSHGDEGQPVIQLALLLDTSNSMDGLINQAKSQLWKIVAQTSRERHHGRRPVLQVALYEYGNDSLSVMNGYVRQVVPFTTDLDYISQRLFELDTNGGSEYCGKVMMNAGRQLDWTSNPYDLKLLFIAGNEPFDQGPVNYERAAHNLMTKDIRVNTIYCGDYEEGRWTGWEHGAQLTGGAYMNINSDYEEAYVRAPQDDRIYELNQRLNNTYLGYGAEGEMKKQMQAEQDTNARGLNMGSFLDRAAVKSSESYSNSGWDLVDAYDEGAVELEEMAPAELPAPMRAMEPEERTEYVKELAEEREALQVEISRLTAEREEYLAEEAARGQEDSMEDTLGSAMVEAIRSAADDKGFSQE